MRWIALGTLLSMLSAGPAHAQLNGAKAQCHTTLFGGTTCVSQTFAPAPHPAAEQGAVATCRFGTGAAARLMCADPKLAAMDTTLGRLYRDAKQSAPPERQNAIQQEQVNWIRARNQKCGLQGKDNAPLEQLQLAQQCMADEIAARITALQHRAESGISGTNPSSVSDITTCNSAKLASARLICADRDLNDADLALSKALQDAKDRLSPNDQQTLSHEQLIWMQERDKRCGLAGKDTAPINELRNSKPCMEREMKARFAALLASTHDDSVESSTPADARDVVISPIGEVTGAQSTTETYHALQFSATSERIRGTIECSAPAAYQKTAPFSPSTRSGSWYTTIDVDDDASSYQLFKNDTWPTALNEIRTVARSACAAALASGSLTNAAGGTIKKLPNIFEAYSSKGLFIAFSADGHPAWSVQTNLAKTREKIAAQLEIHSWVDAAELNKNPYFYRDVVVGLVVQLDQALSQREAVFTDKGGDIYVTGIPRELFKQGKPAVLAGRVTGNKGVIKPSGDEVLVPALDYVGTAACGEICASLAQLPISNRQNYSITALGQ